MAIVIDSDPTTIDADFPWLKGFKGFFPTGGCVVEA
jgi:hypothetical protein